MYKNIFFDLYGTLVDVKTDEKPEFVWEKLALYYGYSGADYDAYDLQARFYKIAAKILNSNDIVGYPELDIQDVFYKLYKDKDIKLKKKMAEDAARVFRMLTTNHLEVYEGVIELLGALQEQKVKINIFANAQDAFAKYELKKVGIKKYIDNYYLSSNYSICKPDKAFYEAVFENMDIKKKETVIISADYKDIEMAKILGIDAIYIDVSDQDMTVNKSEGVSVIKGRNYAEILNKMK